MAALREYLETHFTVRDPEYRPSTEIDDEEKASLKERIGGVKNYDIQTLRRMVQQHPETTSFARRSFPPSLVPSTRGSMPSAPAWASGRTTICHPTCS